MNQRARMLAAGLLWWGLLGVCGWLYGPGLNGPFLLDDAVNLRHLQSLEDDTAYLGDVVHGNISGPLGRPVSMLTFAATYLFGGADPYYFKLHNLVLHLVIANLVCWFALLLARTSGIAHETTFALSVATLWLLSPLFVSTVLYAVQRMTQLATLFALAALVAYVKARVAWPQYRLGAVCGVLLSGVLVIAAFMSKENGLVAILLIILTEFVVIRPESPTRHYLLVERSVWGGLSVMALGGAAVLAFGYGASLLDYSRREFSMVERLLTQTRVLWSYAADFLLPVGQRYGLIHDDIKPSSGLLAPPQTVLALLGLTCVVAWSCLRLRSGRRSLVAYGILFYLLGHLIESTVLPLELYFEHRNYLPAVGLAIALVYAASILAVRFSVLTLPLSVGFAGLVFTAALNLGFQVTWWSTSYLAVIRDIEEHPHSQRANMQMAIILASAGYPESAERFNAIAAKRGDGSAVVKEMRSFALYCIAREPVPDAIIEALRIEISDLSNAKFDEALQIVSDHVVERNCHQTSATRFADMVFSQLEIGQSFTPKVAASMARIENALGRYDNAMRYAEFLVRRNPKDVMAQMMRLYFAWHLGDKSTVSASLDELGALRCGGFMRDEDASIYRQFLESAVKAGYVSDVSAECSGRQ